MAKKMLSAAALTAALAGGGALGALLGTPVISAAQEDSTTTTAPEATDDTTTTTTPEASDGTTTTPPDAADGTEDDTADCGDRLGRPGGRGMGVDLAVAAEVLGMTEDELLDALREGSSIASLAEERGVDQQSVIDDLVAAATARIDERVAAGELDAAEAEEKKADLPERIQAFVEREGGLRFGGRGPHGGPGDRIPSESDGSDQGS